MIWREDEMTATWVLRWHLEGQWSLDWVGTLVWETSVWAQRALRAESRLREEDTVPGSMPFAHP